MDECQHILFQLSTQYYQLVLSLSWLQMQYNMCVWVLKRIKMTATNNYTYRVCSMYQHSLGGNILILK